MDNMTIQEAVKIFKTVYRFLNVLTPCLVNFEFKYPRIIEVSTNKSRSIFGVTVVNVETRKCEREFNTAFLTLSEAQKYTKQLLSQGN